MKKVYLASALLLAVTGAQAYQAEVQGTVGYYDAELNDGNYNVGVQGTYYFKDVDASKGPLAEAAFLNQASSISAGYNFGQLTADINRTVNVNGNSVTINEEFDAEQHTYGIKGEAYIPTSVVPVYASASYNHSKTDAKNDFTALIQNDDSGDRYALELGAMVLPNFLMAVGYTNIAATESLDTFNILNNGLMSATMESRAIREKKDAVTARTKYVGPIDGTDMAIGFEAGLVSGEDTMYQLKTDLYVTPKLGLGVSYTDGSYKSSTVPTSAVGVNASYFVTPAVSLGASYVYADGEYGANDAHLGALNAKFRF
ncbi:hypothetical protein AY605_03315 [Acinetobacter sp. SFD]|uniref:putative porin n=1 Tax=Acinetobacter sp. SFD TaxID=1805635 RepID=UPI0007D05CAB|nr:putative porin [Acinetobacter sp. SFD]OAL87389.1 hypothetical protein AY605_03315 [Acinetobacter sp. SFD]